MPGPLPLRTRALARLACAVPFHTLSSCGPDNPSSYTCTGCVLDKGELAKRLQSLPVAEVLFNYRGPSLRLGSDALLKPVLGGHGSIHSSRGLRDHPLSLVFDVTENGPTATFVYSNRFHRHESIQELAKRFQEYYFGIVLLKNSIQRQAASG